MNDRLKSLTGQHNLEELVKDAQDIAKDSKSPIIKIMATVIKELCAEASVLQAQNAVFLAKLADCELSKAVLREALDDAPAHDPDEDDDILVTAVA